MRTVALLHCHNITALQPLRLIRTEGAGVFSLTATRDIGLGGDKIVFQNYVTMIMGVVGLIVLVRCSDTHPFKNRRIQVFATRSSLTFQHFPAKLLCPRQTDRETWKTWCEIWFLLLFLQQNNLFLK